MIEMQNLREANEDLAMREKQYRSELETLLDSHQQLKDHLDKVSSESRIKNEENKRLKTHYEDKMKDLTAANKKLSDAYQKGRDDMAKKDDEINILMDKIAQMNNEAAMSKRNSSETEVRVKVEWLTGENNKLKEDILKLQQLLESNQKEYANKLELAEKQKQDALAKVQSGKLASAGEE